MNETFKYIMATLLTALAITGVSILIYIISYVIGIEHPELVVASALIVALAFELKDKLLKNK